MPNDIKILYNDTCPVCRFEIDHYRSSAQGLPMRFDALNHAQDWGLTPDQAARRLHVMQGDQLLSGMDAFRAIWAVLPRYRWLARLTALPFIRQILDLLYDRIAAPILYRAHLRRLRVGRTIAP